MTLNTIIADLKKSGCNSKLTVIKKLEKPTNMVIMLNMRNKLQGGCQYIHPKELLIVWILAFTTTKKSILKAGKEESIGTFKVIAFKTQHDAKEPFGYLLKSIITNETLLFATDTYYISNTFDALDYIMISVITR